MITGNLEQPYAANSGIAMDEIGVNKMQDVIKALFFKVFDIQFDKLRITERETQSV